MLGAEWQIVIAEDGQHGTNGNVTLSVLRDGQVRMFKRNAIKNAMTPQVQAVSWLVGELDGVKVYVQEQPMQLNIIMTRQELYP